MVSEARGKTLHIPSTATELPTDWEWKRLDDVCEGIFDCPHSTPKLTSEGLLLARSQDIRTGIFRIENAGRVSEQTYLERIKRAEPSYGDLLYSREGTYFGIAAEVPKNVKVCLGQRMVLLRPVPKILNFRFLRYWLNSPILADHVYGHRDGTVAERLNLPTIRALPIAIPPLPEQKAIAHILGTLDDKIELNREMNQTLEAIAQAIFKSWFVDFDPVRAKMEGRQPAGMDAATAELFPNEFEDSALGMIPRGWRVGKLGDIADNPRRGVQAENIKAGTPYIGLEHIPRGSIALSDWGTSEDITSNKYCFSQGDILFGKLRPYFHKVGVAIQDGVCSTDILVIVPRISEWYSLVLFYVSSVDFVKYTNLTSTGTRMPRTNWQDMARYEIVIPAKETANFFNEQVLPIVDAIRSNIFQSRTLASIRDTLLPKLLSGEIRVKEAEKIAAKAM